MKIRLYSLLKEKVYMYIYLLIYIYIYIKYFEEIIKNVNDLILVSMKMDLLN